MATNDFAEFIETTARLAILKAKAAYTCQVHPDMLILHSDPIAENRAHMIAGNTLKYHDRAFLIEKTTLALQKQLEMAGVKCLQCESRPSD